MLTTCHRITPHRAFWSRLPSRSPLPLSLSRQKQDENLNFQSDNTYFYRHSRLTATPPIDHFLHRHTTCTHTHHETRAKNIYMHAARQDKTRRGEARWQKRAVVFLIPGIPNSLLGTGLLGISFPTPSIPESCQPNPIQLPGSVATERTLFPIP